MTLNRTKKMRKESMLPLCRKLHLFLLAVRKEARSMDILT